MGQSQTVCCIPRMAVGHLLLQSFWANEAIFQLMMMAYNLFLLFKIDLASGTEYRQRIKTFRLKYIHNHHPSGMKMLTIFISRGISV